MIPATVIADASFCPRTRAAGWAAWVTINLPEQTDPLRIKQYGAFYQPPKSSREAELWAVWNGIWIAYNNGARDILAQTDCLDVVRNPSSGRAGMSYSQVRKRYWPEARVRFRHVKGHTDSSVFTGPRFYVNRWCDRHAGLVMRKQRQDIK